MSCLGGPTIQQSIKKHQPRSIDVKTGGGGGPGRETVFGAVLAPRHREKGVGGAPFPKATIGVQVEFQKGGCWLGGRSPGATAVRGPRDQIPERAGVGKNWREKKKKRSAIRRAVGGAVVHHDHGEPV